jgi:hypothetical protein
MNSMRDFHHQVLSLLTHAAHASGCHEVADVLYSAYFSDHGQRGTGDHCWFAVAVLACNCEYEGADEDTHFIPTYKAAFHEALKKDKPSKDNLRRLVLFAQAVARVLPPDFTVDVDSRDFTISINKLRTVYEQADQFA